MTKFSTLAAVDLGSNSFNLQIARVVSDQIYPLDSIRDPVAIAAGLSKDKKLTSDSQEKALDSLKDLVKDCEVWIKTLLEPLAPTP